MRRSGTGIYLPLFPAAVGSFDLRGYDLVLSLSHCAANAVRPAPGALHVCYCFTPMRYIWDLYDEYFGVRAGLVTRLLMPRVAAALLPRRVRVRAVQARGPRDRGRQPSRARIVGTGPEERRLRALAGSSVEFLGWRPDAEVAESYARCRAVLFPADEDYGIVPLEAAAAGRPTIALARGGALETMIGLNTPGEAPTAVFFREQTAEALADAMRAFEAAEDRFEAKALRARAERFDRPLFRQGLSDYIDGRWREFSARRAVGCRAARAWAGRCSASSRATGHGRWWRRSRASARSRACAASRA